MQNTEAFSASIVDEAAVLAAIDRLEKIEPRHDTGRVGSKIALMREYMRRSELVGAAIGCPNITLWFDATAVLSLPGAETCPLPGHTLLSKAAYYPGPGVDVLEEKVLALNQRLRWASTGMHNICFWYIRWEAVKNHPAVTPLALLNPYEPLIVMFERGGSFRMEHGDFVDLEDTMIGAVRPPWIRSLAPLRLDRQTLDTLDELRL